MLRAVPRVSVVIPCYNLGQYLPDAITSVRRQTFSDVEIVVVDDGSTDPATAEALRAAAAPDLTVIRTGNRGLSAARNRGIAEARGEYCSCLDADDVFEAEWLEMAVTRLDTDSGIAFVSHWMELFGEEAGDWTPERADLGALLDQNVFNGAALFRRELVERVGGFDESMRDGCEDWEFWIRVLAAGYRGATIPVFLYRYRRRTDSMSRKMHIGDRWGRVYAELLERQPDAYGEHLVDLLLRREWAIGRMCRGIDAVCEEYATMLEPALRERERELAAANDAVSKPLAGDEANVLRARVDALEHERRRLTAARDAALHHVDALHRSWSWRLTAPLRRIYDLAFSRERAGRSGSA